MEKQEENAQNQSIETSAGGRAREHIRFLLAEIGPRPAGSPQENAAREYIRSQMASWGYHLREQPVPFADRPAFFPAFPLLGAALCAAGWLLISFPLLALLLPFAIYVLPAYTRWAVRRRPRHAVSANLIGGAGGDEKTLPRLILSAHIDSAIATPIRNPLLLRLKYQTMFIVQRIAIALAVFGFVVLLGFPLPGWLHPLLIALSTLAGGWLILSQWIDQLCHGNVYSTGAHDNASGVGVLLALAEELARRHPAYLEEITFLFTGAEETGLHGAEAFCTAFERNDPKPAVLCLDMVGAGSIQYIITGDGTWGKRATDKKLNALLRKVNPHAEDLWYTLRSGDFAAFLRNGFPATGLQTGGELAVDLIYHTRLDTLKVIQTATLEAVCAMGMRFIDKFFQQ